MKILNFGSLNIDRVYSVEHFVQPGETILSKNFGIFCGGKGLNQSIALARAGASICHAGMVGTDGDVLVEALKDAGVNTEYIDKSDGVSGHAVIEVDQSGQNRIIVCGGSNGEISRDYADKVLNKFETDDILLVQNEITNVAYIMEQGSQRGMKIVLNPSPVNEALFTYPLELVDYFILNEVEGRMLAGVESEDGKDILSGLSKKYPKASIILTMGEGGSYFKKEEFVVHHPICQVKVVDTTAAGDTFCGYFLACLSEGGTPGEALHLASLASGIVVSRNGASPSIPTWEEVVEFEKVAIIKNQR